MLRFIGTTGNLKMKRGVHLDWAPSYFYIGGMRGITETTQAATQIKSQQRLSVFAHFIYLAMSEEGEEEE